MRYEISGTIMQTVAIDLAPGETVYSQTNTMAWMNDAVQMDTHTGGGFLAGLKRSFGGGSFFVTDFTAKLIGQPSYRPVYTTNRGNNPYFITYSNITIFPDITIK